MQVFRANYRPPGSDLLTGRFVYAATLQRDDRALGLQLGRFGGMRLSTVTWSPASDARGR